jgi:ketosteroid isomerase-like protein
MKKLSVVVGLLAFLAPVVIAESEMSSSNVQDELRHLEQQWLDAAAVPDLPALRKMFADDFMGTAFGPNVLSKSDVIPPDGTNANHLPKCTLAQSTVRVYGDTAVVMGIAKPQEANDAGFHVTTVFQRRPEGWQIIAIHLSQAKQ